MLEIDGRVLRAVWTVFLFVLAVALIYLTRSVLVIFTLAIFLAHLIAPLVDRVDRYTPRKVSRTLSLTIVYVALVAVALAILIPVGSKVGEQAAALAGRLPDALKSDPLSHFPLPRSLETWRPRLARLHNAADHGAREIGSCPCSSDLAPASWPASEVWSRWCSFPS